MLCTLLSSLMGASFHQKTQHLILAKSTDLVGNNLLVSFVFPL